MRIIPPITAAVLLSAGLGNPGISQERATLKGHKELVRSIAFSPDSKLLASAGGDGNIRLWSVAKGELLSVFNSDTGKEGESFQAGDKSRPNAVAFAPKGEQLGSQFWWTLAVAGDGRTVRLWQLQGDDTDAVIRERAILKGRGNVSQLAYAPDGRTLAVAASPDGRAGNSRVALWTLATNVSLGDYEPRVWCVAFAPDGKTLASSNNDSVLRLWDLTADPPTERAVLKGQWSVAFTSDSKTLAASEGHDIRLYDLTLKAPKVLVVRIEAHHNDVLSVAFSPDGKLLASAGGDAARLWDWDGKGRLTPRGTLKEHSKTVTAVAFSPDGKTLATASEDSTIKLWDVHGLLKQKRE